MARDGSGNYSRVVTPPNNGDIADADDFNAEIDDIATALSDSINKSGTKAFAADQSMGGYKLTNLAAPSDANDAARKAYVDSAITAAAQPLDATLTALAALPWSSGNALVQFTAEDTVSLTLTPSVTSVTATTTSATTPGGTFVNTTDSADVMALRIEGDRATPANGDQVYASWFLSDSAGNQEEFVRIAARGSVVTNGSEVGQLNFGVRRTGGITTLLALSGASTAVLTPGSNDLVALGSTTLSWADLFLASGGVINWANGDVTVTHSTNALEVAGGGFAAPLLESSETTGTLTVASRNRIVRCSGGVTLDDGVFDKEDWLVFDAGASNRTFTRAAGLTMYVNGVDSATATLPANTSGGAIWRSSTVVVLSGAFY